MPNRIKSAESLAERIEELREARGAARARHVLQRQAGGARDRAAALGGRGRLRVQARVGRAGRGRATRGRARGLRGLMGRLDSLDLSLKLSKEEEAKRIETGQERLTRCGSRWAASSRGTRPAWGRRSACCSRAGTPRARAAPSSGSWSRSTPGTCAWRVSAHPRTTRSATTSSGASGPRCRAGAAWPCSTAPGTGACSSSASRALPPSSEGRARIRGDRRARALALHRGNDPGQVLAAHLRRGAAQALQGRARRIRSSSGRSPRRTGATARSAAEDYSRPSRTMLERTDHELAPWHLVEADSKPTRA